MIADKFDECGGVRLPVHREALEIFEHRPQASDAEERNGVFCIFIEVGVENPLIHVVGVAFDRKEDPAQIMQLQDGKCVRLGRDRVLNVFSVFVEDVLAAGNYFREDREAVARRGLGKDRPVSSLLRPCPGNTLPWGSP